MFETWSNNCSWSNSYSIGCYYRCRLFAWYKIKRKGKIERIKIVCETLRKTQKDPIIDKDEVESLLKNEIQEEIKKEIKNCIKGEKSHKQRKTAGKKIADFIKFFWKRSN